MARDFDRSYGDYRRSDYNRDDYRNRGRGSDRDDARDSYSGGKYFYEGRTYASDRNQPGGYYGREYPNERPNWDRSGTYQDFTDRNFGTDYDRDRGHYRDRTYGNVGAGDYGSMRDPGSDRWGTRGNYGYDRDNDQNRYGYSRDYDRSRDWDYDQSRSYSRGYGRNEERRWDDAWNGYGYGPQDERRGMGRSSFDRGDYNRGEFPRTDHERSGYGRGNQGWDQDRNRTGGSYMNRSDTWDRDNEPYRGEWQTGDRSWRRDYDRDEDRNEDWGRRYDRNWGNSSFDPNRRRREMETH